MSEDQSSIDGTGHRHTMSMIFVQYFSGMLCLKLFNETSWLLHIAQASEMLDTVL